MQTHGYFYSEITLSLSLSLVFAGFFFASPTLSLFLLFLYFFPFCLSLSSTLFLSILHLSFFTSLSLFPSFLILSPLDTRPDCSCKATLYFPLSSISFPPLSIHSPYLILY